MDRIVVDARVHFGKPCVAGKRITVQDVPELVDQELAFKQIIQDYYPELTAADIDALHPLCDCPGASRGYPFAGGAGLRFDLDRITCERTSAVL